MNDERRPAAPPATTNQRRSGYQPIRLGSQALARLTDLETALFDLAQVEPRGAMLATVLWLVSERIERHHLRPHASIVYEWLEAA
jgi:hypothetical protein